jgi:hypothetical protein
MTHFHRLGLALAFGLMTLGMLIIAMHGPDRIAGDQAEEQHARAQTAAIRTSSATRALDPISQVTGEEVTHFATTFVQDLGYTVHGQVQCHPWRFDVWHLHYECYAVFDPAQPPLVLTCGPQRAVEVWPLQCALVIQH